MRSQKRCDRKRQMKVVSSPEIETKCNKIHISIGLIVPFTIPLRYIARQQRIISLFFLVRVCTWKKWKRRKKRAGYPWKDNESDEKKEENMNTATAAATNVVKTVKTCVILCWCSTTSEAPKMVFDGSFFPSQYINIVTAGQKMKADAIEMTITFGMFVCVFVSALTHSRARAPACHPFT